MEGEFKDTRLCIAFKSVHAELVSTKKIKNNSHLARRLFTYNHVINAILRGNRKPTLAQIGGLVSLYGVNANFFFIETKQMFNYEEA
mgnify:CR=1 FL=1